MEKSVIVFGVISIVTLSLTLIFVGSITGRAVADEQQNYVNISFVVLVVLVVAINEVIRYYERNKKSRDVDIKKLIEEYGV